MTRFAYHHAAAPKPQYCHQCGARLVVRDGDDHSGYCDRRCVEKRQTAVFGATVRELAAHPERAVVAKRTVSESSVAVMMAAYQKRVRR